jgi:hypothetical protein
MFTASAYVIWNGSQGMNGCPLAPYFDHWYGPLYYGWLPNMLLIDLKSRSILFGYAYNFVMDSYDIYFAIALSVKI